MVADRIGTSREPAHTAASPASGSEVGPDTKVCVYRLLEKNFAGPVVEEDTDCCWRQERTGKEAVGTTEGVESLAILHREVVEMIALGDHMSRVSYLDAQNSTLLEQDRHESLEPEDCLEELQIDQP